MGRLEDVIWAAGFFDGEGCISVGVSFPRTMKVPSHHLSIYVSQVDPAPIEVLRGLWGGKSRFKRSPQPKHRDYYWWSIHQGMAARACEEMLPYLRVKADEARLAIEFDTLINHKVLGRAHSISADNLQRRQEIYRGLQVLKRRTIPQQQILPELVSQQTSMAFII